jgi:hypothetical protein
MIIGGLAIVGVVTVWGAFKHHFLAQRVAKLEKKK